MPSCHHPTGLLIAGFGSLFSLGLVGSLHCLGMCGPLSLLLTHDQGPRPGLLALYHLARLAAYAALGAAIWHLGAPLRLALPWPYLAALVSVPLLAYALFPALELPGFLGRWHAAAFRAIRHIPAASRALGLGFLTPLLPCGLLYAAAGYSLSAPNPLIAAAWMASFGAGTLPLLAAGQAGWTWFATLRQGSFALALRRVSALLAAGSVLALGWAG
jgi:hypothetical protein